MKVYLVNKESGELVSTVNVNNMDGLIIDSVTFLAVMIPPLDVANQRFDVDENKWVEVAQ